MQIVLNKPRTKVGGAGGRPVGFPFSKRAHILLAWLACALVLACPAASAAAQTFQLGDVHKIVELADPQISPNGKEIAVVVSTPDWQTDTYKTEIDLVNVASDARRDLTSGREDVSSPTWSPDGRYLAFLAKDPTTGSPEVFVLPMDGGDARRVTSNKQGVDDYSWSPDGKTIAFVAQDPAPSGKGAKTHDKSFRITDGNFLLTKQEPSWQLWVVPSAGGKATQVTNGTFSLDTVSSAGPGAPAWSADGTHIAFTKYPTPFYTQSFHSVIAEVDVEGHEVQTLVPAEDSSALKFSPAGGAYAFVRPRGGDRNNGNAIYVHAHGKTNDVTAALARSIDTFTWMPNGKALLLSGTLGTHSVFWIQPLSGSARLLDLDGVEANDGLGVMNASEPGSSASISRAGVIAFIGSTSTHPSELYVLGSTRDKPRRLTDVNAFLDKLDLGRTESISWTSPDGFHDDGVLTYPPGYRAGNKYPLVLMIHGGPMLSSNAGFQQLAQLLAAAGFVVFQPNYRGSDNLGDAFQHAIYRDTGEGPGKDVMAGLEAVEKLGIVDTSRIGVSGWSYGGFMTTWLTSHYNVWKAAVAGAPLTDWILDYTISFYQDFDVYLFGSRPFTDKGWDIWRAQSPITYVRNVHAPTLLMGDVMDANVPLANAYEWYKGLQDNGVPVEFHAYPESTHEPHDIVQITDVFRRWLDWMKAYLDQAPSQR